MKLTNKQIRQLIREELQNVLESQKEVGLPHEYSDMELYHHAFNFLKANPDLRTAAPEVKEKGEKLLRILHNAVQQAVKHSTYRQGDMKAFMTDVDAYQASLGKQTSPEETAQMKEMQGKLKMVRNALANALPGHKHDYSGGSGNRAAMSARMRELDPTGSRQRYGRFTPSDDPQLRAQMPEYQPGGRFYNPDDIIHKK